MSNSNNAADLTFRSIEDYTAKIQHRLNNITRRMAAMSACGAKVRHRGILMPEWVAMAADVIGWDWREWLDSIIDREAE